MHFVSITSSLSICNFMRNEKIHRLYYVSHVLEMREKYDEYYSYHVKQELLTLELFFIFLSFSLVVK